MTPLGWFLGVVYVLFLLAVAVVSYKTGEDTGDREILEATTVNLQFQRSNMKFVADTTEQKARLAALQDKLTSVQAELDAIMLPESTSEIGINQSKIFAGGRLTIGLIGFPTNEGVNINVNGKHQVVATGDIINVELDPSTSCRVVVKSFNMSRAVVTATCPAAKP